MDDLVILVGNVLMNRLCDIFITWGIPLPNVFISNNYYGEAYIYLNLERYNNISNKNFFKLLKNVQVPKTYFEGDIIDLVV